MKYLVYLCALIAVAVAFPQREGQQFTNEAIRQAQDSYLIPRDAQIQNVNWDKFLMHIFGLLMFFMTGPRGHWTGRIRIDSRQSTHQFIRNFGRSSTLRGRQQFARQNRRNWSQLNNTFFLYKNTQHYPLVIYRKNKLQTPVTERWRERERKEAEKKYE